MEVLSKLSSSKYSATKYTEAWINFLFIVTFLCCAAQNWNEPFYEFLKLF